MNFGSSAEYVDSAGASGRIGKRTVVLAPPLSPIKHKGLSPKATLDGWDSRRAEVNRPAGWAVRPGWMNLISHVPLTRLNFFLASDYELEWRNLAKRTVQPHGLAGFNDIRDDAHGMVKRPDRVGLVSVVVVSEGFAVPRVSGIGADVNIP